MTLVVDASLVLAALVDAGSRGRWARDQLQAPTLLAPHLLPVEVLSGLRRLVRVGTLSISAGGSALHDFRDLAVELYPIDPFLTRVWHLRDNLTAYDACYVALAEAHDCPLGTLDGRLVAAAGTHCAFATPG